MSATKYLGPSITLAASSRVRETAENNRPLKRTPRSHSFLLWFIQPFS
jgi:hypothetical protein